MEIGLDGIPQQQVPNNCHTTHNKFYTAYETALRCICYVITYYVDDISYVT